MTPVHRDDVAAILHECLARNLLDDLPAGCEAGYMLADALTAAGLDVVIRSWAALSAARTRADVVPLGPQTAATDGTV